MKIIDGMNYRQWQKRNTDAFQALSKQQQQVVRQQGYYNVAWAKVQQSWAILQKMNEVPSLFDAKLNKGDLIGAVDQGILEAEQAHEAAEQALNELERKRSKIKDIANEALNEYQLL